MSFNIYFVKFSKKVTLLLVCCAIFSSSYGQGFYHGIGAQYNVGSFKQDFTASNIESSTSSSIGVPGIFYKATLALSEKFAVSAYPFLGFSGSANSRSGTNGSFSLQLPVVAELYFGEIDESCFFVGAGLSYASIGSTDTSSGNIVGPQVSVGGQFEISGKLIGIRAAYSPGLNKSDEIAGVEYTKDSRSMLSLGAYYLFD